jgi:phenylalanyl-tRNA synthetase beta chain
MLVPVKWLKDYIDIEDLAVSHLEERLIMSGSNTETVSKICDGVSGIKVGKIESMERHPDADKLWVMQVRVGEELLQIVTAAQNSFVGAFIPVAVHGSTVAGGTKIKKGKLRGVESQGMFCSLEELGFEGKVIPKAHSEGIYILQGEYQTGELIEEALPELADQVIEFEITPNRPDCLSMLGMARETAATFNKALKPMDIKVNQATGNAADHVNVRIDAPDLCKRYGAKIIKNVKIEESPQWMQLRLMKAGMRPISNIVDITNYVMLEFGQPIHAFDLDTIHSGEIVVRRAVEGEKLTTLDSVERTLSSEMLVIADGEKAVALAGVMGGELTEITDGTKNILIEVATFEKANIRKTSKDIGLRSEASSRFEKGVAVCHVEPVMARVCQLAEMLGIGEIVDGAVDVYPNPENPICITARVARINSLLGTTLSTAEMIRIFESLEIKATETQTGELLCQVPAFRLDLVKEIDLVEEIARIYGYDRIATTIPKDASAGVYTYKQKLENKTKDVLTALGLNEIMTYSFVSPSQVDLLNVPKEDALRKQIRLLNPLGEEYSAMRTSLMGNMMEVLSRNYNRRLPAAAAFEIGNVFIPKALPVTELPSEVQKVVMGGYGEGMDFFRLKGCIEIMLEKMGVVGCEFVPESQNSTFHPGRCANIIKGEVVLGIVGELHPEAMEAYGLEVRTYLAELNFTELVGLSNLEKKYQPLPKYPAMTRDIAVLVKDEVTNGQIINLIQANGKGMLESVKLFDVYKGKQIEDGWKSMAYALVFRAADRTLTDEEVNKVFQKILNTLETEVEAKLR